MSWTTQKHKKKKKMSLPSYIYHEFCHSFWYVSQGRSIFFTATWSTSPWTAMRSATAFLGLALAFATSFAPCLQSLCKFKIWTILLQGLVDIYVCIYIYTHTVYSISISIYYTLINIYIYIFIFISYYIYILYIHISYYIWISQSSNPFFPSNLGNVAFGDLR